MDVQDSRRARWALIRVAAVVTVLGAGVTAEVWHITTPNDERSGTATDLGDGSPAVSGAGDGAVAHPVQSRSGASLAWTGTELVVWGGQDEGGVHVDGGRFDPGSGAWRDIPPAPIEPNEGDTAVVVGERLIVCCGGDFVGATRAAASFDLDRREWIAIPAPPVAVSYPGAVSIGREAVFVGEDHLLVYDTERDIWEERAPPPPDMWAPDVAWSGERLYAWSTASGGGNFGAEYDLGADTWSVMPDPPVEARPTYADIEWTDAGLAVWGVDHSAFRYPGPGDVGVGAIFDPSARVWTPMPHVLPAAVPYDGNTGSQSLLGSGDRLYITTGALATGIEPTAPLLLSYDVRADIWRRLPVTLHDQHSIEMVAMGAYGIVILDGGNFVVVAYDEVGEPITSLVAATQPEQEFVWWLRYYAVLGQREHFDRIPFAATVRVGAGEQVVERTPAELVDAAGWTVEGVDVIGALRVLDQPNDVTVDAGDQTLPCADRPAPLMDGRRLTIAPRADVACDEWFALELYLDGEGRLAAVRLVL